MILRFETKKMYRTPLIPAVVFLIIHLGFFQIAQCETVISPSNPHLLYTGRINFSDPNAPIFYWSGTSVIARFEGTSIKVDFNDSNVDTNYFYAIIDDGSPILLTLTPGL